MSDYVEEITKLTVQLALPGLKLVRKSLREFVSSVDFALIQSYINLMNFRIRPMAKHEGKALPSFNFQRTIRRFCNKYISCKWGIYMYTITRVYLLHIATYVNCREFIFISLLQLLYILRYSGFTITVGSFCHRMGTGCYVRLRKSLYIQWLVEESTEKCST